MATPEQIDICIKKVAAEKNVPFRTILKILSDRGLIDMNSGSDDTVFIDGIGNVPRRIPNVEVINMDPDTFIKNNISSTKQLEDFVQMASYLYYNYDGGGLSDNAFDAIQYILKKRRDRKNRSFEKIGAEPVEKIRTQLPFPMPSLNKVKPGEISLLKFLTANHSLAWSLKLDGVSAMITFKNGKVDKMYTRGDGSIGGDVTYLKKHVKNIPKKVTADYVVRGEFMISKRVWEEKYINSGYSNPRALVSGKVNSGTISPAMNDIEFIAYSIIKIGNRKEVPSPSHAFNILSSENFVTVENGSFFYPTVQQIANLYIDKRKTSEFNIDGIVLSADIINSSNDKGNDTATNPINSVAFKMLLAEQIRDTVITNVEWNISRYGRYVPVAIYQSVYIDGTRLHRASAHNARHIRDWSMGSGTKIQIVKSGDVIPKIHNVDIDEDIEPIFPPNNRPGYEWEWSKSDIVLTDIENNPDVHMARNLHFFSTMGIAGIGEVTIQNFYKNGLKTINDIVNCSVKDFQKIKGIGKIKSENFYNNIKKVLTTIPIDRYFVAITGFNSSLGRKLIKILFRHLPNVIEMSSVEIADHFKKFPIKGFGKVRIADIVKNMPLMKTRLYGIHKEYVKESIKYNKIKNEQIKISGGNPKIRGQKFVLTGFMGNNDYDFEDYIYDNGGDFLEEVTKDVTAVIAASVSTTSGKIIKATELEIQVFTLQEFIIRYNVDIEKFRHIIENNNISNNIDSELSSLEQAERLHPTGDNYNLLQCIASLGKMLSPWQRKIIDHLSVFDGAIICTRKNKNVITALTSWLKCELENSNVRVQIVSEDDSSSNLFIKELDSSRIIFSNMNDLDIENIDCESTILIIFSNGQESLRNLKKLKKYNCNFYKNIIVTKPVILDEPYDIVNIVAMVKKIGKLSRSKFNKILLDDELFNDFFRDVFIFHEKSKFTFYENNNLLGGFESRIERLAM